MHRIYQVNQAICRGCGACLYSCAFGALSFELKANIDASRCTGCGNCKNICPFGAIYEVKGEARFRAVVRALRIRTDRIRERINEVKKLCGID